MAVRRGWRLLLHLTYQAGISQRIFKPDNCGKHDLWQTVMTSRKIKV